MIAFLEPRLVIRVGRGAQLSVQIKGPGVIAAPDQLFVRSVFFDQLKAAMATEVQKTAQLASGVAGHEYIAAPDAALVDVARFRHFGDRAQELPGAFENRIDLEVVDLLVCVGVNRQAAEMREIFIDFFEIKVQVFDIVEHRRRIFHLKCSFICLAMYHFTVKM